MRSRFHVPSMYRGIPMNARERMGECRELIGNAWFFHVPLCMAKRYMETELTFTQVIDLIGEIGAGDRDRTDDIQLGKLAFYS